ncbi:hypothetical protein TIFTF001_052396 [Ficus carica]|uniref:Uncharacterized protein n=1 Tax=Ficus carica TaxID=3494 RepID=A0AA88EMD4_FICCA|nr:hypothetical protein TIFTF001_052396 [Ficus carica]
MEKIMDGKDNIRSALQPKICLSQEDGCQDLGKLNSDIHY